MDKRCARCGVLFQPTSGNAKYCSTACKKAEAAERARRKRAATTAEQMKQKPCAMCGKPYQPANGYSKYCSDACRKAAWRKRYEAEKAAKKLPDIPCVICGTPFSPRGKESKYCSDACRRIAVRHSYDKYRQQEHKTPKKPKTVPPKPRKPPAVTIEEVCGFQAEYRRLHGVWLGYPQAVEKMREMGFRV